MDDKTNSSFGVWTRASVAVKLAIIPAVFVAGFATTIIYTSVRVAETKHDSLVIDMAGRQRMLNQRYQREVLLVAEGVEVDPGATAAVVSSTLAALMNGGPAILTLGKPETRILPPAPTPEIVALLDVQKRQFDDLTERTADWLATPPDSPEFVTKRQELLDAGTTLHFVMNDAVKAFEKHARERIESIVLMQAGIAIVAMMLGGLIAWNVRRSIVSRLGEAAAALDQVARGDLTAQMYVTSNDEIGHMSTALNAGVASMRQAMNQIARSSQSLAAASQELATVSQQVGNAAEECATQSRAVSGDSQQVTANVKSVATAVEEMGISVREIARNATSAERLASDAVRSAESTDATVAKLGDSSSEIGKVVKVITTIAEQTNLLALNATIEAARAGEFGKGFAVVANEVKELAKMTSKATETIAERVAAIQVDASESVGAIRSIRDMIEGMSRVSVTIASAVEEQAAATQHIGDNVVEIANRNDKISSNVSSVAEGARGTTAAVHDMAQATGDLARMASELDRLVGRFQLGETSPVGGSRVVALKPRPAASEAVDGNRALVA